MAKKNKSRQELIESELEMIREKQNNLYEELRLIQFKEAKSRLKSYINKAYEYNNKLIYIKDFHPCLTYFNAISIRKDNIFMDSAVDYDEIGSYTEIPKDKFDAEATRVIDKLSTILPRKNGVYEMNDVEYNRYKRILTKINRSPIDMGAAGGRVSIEFTPTGIGTVVVLKDNGTGKTYDITHFESW
jgi:hypothetical protein